MYVTDKIAEDPSGTAISEISIAQPHRAMLRLVDLQPNQLNRSYESTWRLFDPNGREMVKTVFRFTPPNTPFTVWHKFSPNHKVDKAGRWKWMVDVPELGRYATEIGILPATPTELDELARHEKARESVFRAFSHYWLAHTNDCFTTFTQTGTVTTEVVRKESQLPANDASMYSFTESEMRGSLAQLMVQRSNARERARARGPMSVEVEVSKDVILQVRGLDNSFSQGFVSEANRLNGVNYRGSATFGFRLYRFFVQGTGWSDWQDVISAPGELMQSLANFLGMNGIPGDLEGRLVVSFEILERDGNWFVTCNNGDRFSNGKLVSQGKPLNTVPVLSQVERLVVRGVNVGREEDRQLGKFARDNPVPLEQEIIATMNQLRGRPLQ